MEKGSLASTSTSRCGPEGSDELGRAPS
jgi:hypothetical protein